MILHTIDFNTSRDAFESWVYYEIGEKQHIQIKKNKVIVRFTFMVIASKLEDQKRLLMEKFVKLFNKMVSTISWTTDFDASSMRITQAPIWIKFPMLHLVYEYYSNQLLVKVGKVIYAQTSTIRSKISSHPRMCLMKLRGRLH